MQTETSSYKTDENTNITTCSEQSGYTRKQREFRAFCVLREKERMRYRLYYLRYLERMYDHYAHQEYYYERKQQIAFARHNYVLEAYSYTYYERIKELHARRERARIQKQQIGACVHQARYYYFERYKSTAQQLLHENYNMASLARANRHLDNQKIQKIHYTVYKDINYMRDNIDQTRQYRLSKIAHEADRGIQELESLSLSAKRELEEMAIQEQRILARLKRYSSKPSRSHRFMHRQNACQPPAACIDDAEMYFYRELQINQEQELTVEPTCEQKPADELGN